MMVACSRLQDMQKKVGLVIWRAGPLLPQITCVIFAWLVFAACTASKGAFHLSELAGRTTAGPVGSNNEIGFLLKNHLLGAY